MCIEQMTLISIIALRGISGMMWNKQVMSTYVLPWIRGWDVMEFSAMAHNEHGPCSSSPR